MNLLKLILQSGQELFQPTDERNAIMNTFPDAYENNDREAALSIFAEDAYFT